MLRTLTLDTITVVWTRVIKLQLQCNDSNEDDGGINATKAEMLFWWILPNEFDRNIAMAIGTVITSAEIRMLWFRPCYLVC